jgi:hypothetical protein
MLRGGIAVAICIAVCVGHAQADDESPIEKARAAIDDLDYTGAKTLLVEALKNGTNSPEQLIEIYKLTGTVAASLSDSKLAVEAFRKLLALDPKASLPSGTSPRITKPFTEASKKKLPLVVKTETAAKPPSVTVVIEADPMTMVASAKVLFAVDGKPEQTLDGKGKDKIKIDLPKGRRIDLRVEALDEYGNRLVELGTKSVPIVITGEPEVVVIDPKKLPPKVVAKKGPPRSPRPLYLKWWMWTGAAVLFGGATTYFAIQAKSDIDDLQTVIDTSINHKAGEADDLEDSARRNILFTNIGLGATAVFAVGATILFLTDPSGDEPRNVGVVPVNGGGAVVVGGEF